MNWSSGLRIPGGDASLAVRPIPLTGQTVGNVWAGTVGGMYETYQTFVWWERVPDLP